MLRSEATLLVILKWLGAGHHYERSPSTNCIKQLTSDRWCEKRKSPDEIGTLNFSVQRKNSELDQDNECRLQHQGLPLPAQSLSGPIA